MKAIRNLTLTLSMLIAISPAQAAEEVTLASGQQARMPIVVGQQASERTKAAAQTLADYLGRISGAAFTVTPGDGAAGVVVGTPGDFSRLPFSADFPGGPRGREDYLLRSASGGLWALGASDLGVQHAVWDLLYRLGHRQFFPGPVWEVTPVQERLAIQVEARESPAFCSRRIWYNWGTLDYNGQPYVGMYAYNRHCPPPAIAVDPHVIISSTTAFITGGFTQDQIIDGWKAQGATIGIYDYYSVVDWDWNLPGRAKAARPQKIADSIRDFHGKGARFYDCESGDCWGPCGLGYYIAARAMWDLAEAEQVQTLTEDFLTRAFGPANEPMRDYYQLLNFDSTPRPMSDLLGRLYRALAAARTAAAGRPDVRARIDQLVLYTRYAELVNAQANGKAPRDEMLAFAWRQRKNMLVHVYGLWSVTIGQHAALDPQHPLKSDAAFSDQEIETILQDGIANNAPVEMGFTLVAFSEHLVPSTPLNLPAVPPGSFPTEPQDKHRYLTWVSPAPAELTLQVTVQRVWNLRPHQITLSSPLEVTGKPVDVSDIVRPDGTTYAVKLKTPHEGLHEIEVTDGGDFTRIAWPEGMPVTLPSGFDMPHVGSHFRGGWTLYCYVPRGTRVVGGWAARIASWAPRLAGVLKDGDGNVVFDFSRAEDG